MPTTFNPVFIVALGGTGAQVARHLRDRLVWRYGDAHRIPFVRFLFVDTDHNNPDAAGPDGILVNPPPGQVERMLTHPDEFAHIGLKDWIDMEALKRADKGGFQQGASGVRMFGRLAFLSAQSFQNMWQQMSLKIRTVTRVTDTDIKEQLDLEADAELSVGPARCYVISSSCGGTGAGTFIDIGYMLREILNQEGIQAERIGVLATARQDATSERQFTRNTAALLSELDYYNRSGVVYEAKFPQQPPFVSRAAAYDFCYITSPSGPTGEMPFGDYIHSLAEYVYVDVIAQTLEAQSRRVDFGPDMAEFDLDGYPLRFLALGVSSIEFPADVCHKACYYGTICDLVQTWLRTDPRRLEADGVLPVDPSDRDLNDLMHRVGVGPRRWEDDRLLDELTVVPEDLQADFAGIRPQDWMNDQIRRTFDAEPSTEALMDLEHRLESVLGKDGYFTKCVEQNTRRLRGGRHMERMVLDVVTPIVFDLHRGPRYALGMVQHLRERLRTELQRLDTELKASIVATYTLEDARQAVQAVRRDWLLRIPPGIGFGWINASAARREMRRPQVQVCDMYNRRVEHIVLAAKHELLAQSLSVALETLEKRLTHLLEYLVKWHDEANVEYTRIMQRPLDRRTAMLFSEAVVVQKMDRVMRDADEGTRDKFYDQVLAPERAAPLLDMLQAQLDRDYTQPFTGAYPKDAARGGGIQLKYVEPVSRYIQERYRRRAPAGQPPIIYDERVIERFQEAAVQSAGLTTEIAQVVRESMEMLELDLQHPRYSDIQPVNPRDGWWAFFRGAQAPDEWTEFKTQLSNAVNAAAGTTGVTAPNPRHWLQEIEDPYMVLLLRERAAFPTRIIRGYDIEQREQKIMGTRATAGRVPEMTAFARTGIRPQPPSERDLREAEQFFLGAVLLGLLNYSQTQQEFSMELAQAPGMPRRLLVLPTDFGVTVGELAYRNETRTILGPMIQDAINEMGPERILEITEGVKNRIEVTDTGTPRTHEMAILGLRELNDAQAANIIRGFEAHFGLAPQDARAGAVSHPYADLNLAPPPGRRPGYYCRNRGCGIYLGENVQAIPPECPHCHQSFVPYAER